jgi:lysophospholipase
VLGAGDDPVCATHAAALFAGALGEGAFVPVPESRHEILMERDPIRAAFWRAFDAFVPTEGEPGSAPQPLQDLGMEPPVAAGDDGAARGR